MSKESRIICTNCQQEFYAIPKKSLLGFKKYSCPHCKEKVLYPMDAGQLMLNWGIIFILLCLTAAAFGNGGMAIPGLISIIAIIAVIKDIVLRHQVKKLFADKASETSVMTQSSVNKQL